MGWTIIFFNVCVCTSIASQARSGVGPLMVGGAVVVGIVVGVRMRVCVCVPVAGGGAFACVCV